MDEINMHVPQSTNAQNEIKDRIMISKNIIYAQKNAPTYGPKLDSIIGPYELTDKKVLLTKSQYYDALTYGGNTNVEPPAIVYPKKLWTGKQVFSSILYEKVNYTFGKSKTISTKSMIGNLAYDFKEKVEDVLSLNKEILQDKFTIIQNGKLLLGKLTGKVLGLKTGSLLHIIANDIGYEEAMVYLNNLQRIACYYMLCSSYSIGFSDFVMSRKLQNGIKTIIRDANIESQELINQYNLHTLQLLPGTTEEESFEEKINGILGAALPKFGEITMRELPNGNRLKGLVDSEAKGKPDNAAQIVSALGQQSIEGGRVKLGYYSGRSSLCDPIKIETHEIDKGLFQTKYIKDVHPTGRGFIAASFLEGLFPNDFYFHAMTARETMLNTKLKTGETGYMQRRLTKSMEDISVRNDGTVRNAYGLIVQFKYGDDGIDAQKVENIEYNHITIGCPFNPERLLLIAKINSGKSSHPLLTDEKIIGEKIGKCMKQIDNELFKKIIKQHYSIDTIKNQINEVSLNNLLTETVKKYQASKIKPGEMVGCFAAQCIGEPLTQMILKSFHQAGIGSKKITQGVPRINELVGVITNIKAPSMIVTNLKDEKTEKVIERKMLKDYVETVAVSVEEIDLDLVGKWFTTAEDLERIRKSSNEVIKIKLKFKDDYSTNITENISVKEIIERIDEDLQKDVVAYGSGNELHIRLASEIVNQSFSNSNTKEKTKIEVDEDNYTLLMVIRNELIENLIISGYKDIKNVYPRDSQSSHDIYDTDGSNLLFTLGTEGVDTNNTKSNSVTEMFKIFGIEIARRVLFEEMRMVIGPELNPHHLLLLADAMTVRGYIMPITRSGINRIQTSPLLKASFEEMMEMLTEASFKGELDQLSGVSEGIMLGKLLNIGSVYRE